MFVVVSKNLLGRVVAGANGNGVEPPKLASVQTGGNGVIPPSLHIGTDPFDPEKPKKIES